MNFDEAIQSHSSWKMKLSNYLRKPDGSLKTADVELDGKCGLGEWIGGDGLKFAAMPEFQLLKREHTHFHKAAAEVVRKADKGQQVTEEIALGGKSDFCKASTAVVGALMTMRSKIKP